MKYINKIIIVFLILLIFPFNVFAFSFSINSKEVIFVNLNDKSILYEQNSREKTGIASLTKIMTAVVVLDNIADLDEKVMLVESDFNGLKESEASVSGLKINNYYSYRELLYGLLLESGADCANALSRLVATSIPNFVKLMNDKAKELGMNDTHFVNPIGLDSFDHYSTAYDIYLLFYYAISNNDFLNIIKTTEYVTQDHTKLTNTINYYKKKFNLNMNYLIGGKTGYDTLAEYCLASIATYNKVDYLLITLNAPYDKNSPNHFIDASNIYEYYINNYTYQTVFSKNSLLVKLNTKYAKNKNIEINADKDYSYYLENNYDKEKLTTIYKGKKTISYKDKINQKLGVLDVYYDKNLIGSIDIYLKKQIKFNIISYFKEETFIFYSFLGSVLLISLITYYFLKRRKK